MGTPSVILTSQFTTPSAKSFTKYLNYTTRKEALEEKKESNKIEHEDIENEITFISNHIDELEMEKGKIYSSSGIGKKEFSKKEYEAELILQDRQSFLGNDEEYGRYIGYMGRQYALEKKEKRSKYEEKELAVVRKKNEEYNKRSQTNSKDRVNSKISGVFSINKTEMTNEDLEEVREIVNNAQKNGSVFYQDVISFDSDFLIKEKLYDPETDTLNEQRLQDASRKMMDSMFKDENLESAYWFATIHRNTEHLHIHYGTVEYQNTRKIITVKENGEELFEPKGKRKQKTLDNMKSSFANELVDRTTELTRISELRNTVVQEIKESYEMDKEELQQSKLIIEIYDSLPTNKRYWQYGNKNVSDSTRDKIDELTELLMKENPSYKEYLDKVKEEGEYRKELFGETKRDDKDYAKNREEEIKKRLGNSLLKEMKRTDDITYFKDTNSKYNYKKELSSNKKSKKYIPPSKKNLYHLKRTLNDDLEMYRAEKEYEYISEQIEREQAQNEL